MALVDFYVVGVWGRYSERCVSGRWLMPAQAMKEMFELKCNRLLVTLLYAHTAFFSDLADDSSPWDGVGVNTLDWYLSPLVYCCHICLKVLIQRNNCRELLELDAKEDGCFSVCLGEHLKKYQARSLTVGFKLLCRVIDGKRNGLEGVLKEDALSPGTWHSYVRFLVVCTHNTYMQY